MLLLHVGAIRAAWGAVFDDSGAIDWVMGGARLAVLIASAAFFALKIADVRQLRLKPGWRPLVASVAVIALLHVNVARNAVESDSPYSAAPVAALAVLGTLVESSTLRRSLARVTVLFGDTDSSPNPKASLGIAFSYSLSHSAPLQALFRCGVLLPRPPPFL